MKEGWQKKRLFDASDLFADGDWIETKDQSPQGIRLVQTGNVGEGVFKAKSDKARYVSADTFRRLRCTEVFAGDCLISRLPEPVGRACLLPNSGERMITGVDCTIVRFDRDQLLPEFFSYYSQSDLYLSDVEEQTTGTTRKRISRSKLGQVFVPTPPISEQRRIVAILDEDFAGIATAKANAEKNLQNARAVFESHLGAVFAQRGEGWEGVCLADVCEITSSLVDPRQSQYLSLPHVGGANIVSKTGELVDLKTAKEEGLVSRKFLFDQTTVLYSKIRPYLMKVARPDFQGLCSADIYPLSPIADRVDRGFLHYLLLSQEFTDYANAGSARAGMPKVNRNHLFRFPIHLPSLERQKELATCLDALDEEARLLEAGYQRKVAALEALKKSLLHQAFTGQLTSRAA